MELVALAKKNNKVIDMVKLATFLLQQRDFATRCWTMRALTACAV
jgi:hypothetical protein